MKIQINEFEFYELIIPENIDQSGFLGLLDRLNAIAKLINRTTVFNSQCKKLSKPRQRYHTKGARSWFSSKEEAIILLKKYYIDKDKLDAELKSKHNISIATFKKDITEIKNRWKLKPSDVNLSGFPTKGNLKVNFLTPVGRYEDE